MFADRQDADPFFARIQALDLECPRCAAVFSCRSGNRGPYSARLGRFTCPRCSLTLAIGVIAYPVTRANGPRQPPPDWTPTPRQALALRANLAAGQLAIADPADPTSRKSFRDPHNVILRPDCRCELDGALLIVHPACPHHSAQALARRRLASAPPARTPGT